MASKPNRKRQAWNCSANTNGTVNLNWLAMLHIDGLVDNDRLPPHNDRAMLNHYGLRLIDHVLGFCGEFSASDDSSGNCKAACELAGEFHGLKKQGWFDRGISPLDATTLAFVRLLLRDVPHQQL